MDAQLKLVEDFFSSAIESIPDFTSSKVKNYPKNSGKHFLVVIIDVE